MYIHVYSLPVAIEPYTILYLHVHVWRAIVLVYYTAPISVLYMYMCRRTSVSIMLYMYMCTFCTAVNSICKVNSVHCICKFSHPLAR